MQWKGSRHFLSLQYLSFQHQKFPSLNQAETHTFFTFCQGSWKTFIKNTGILRIASIEDIRRTIYHFFLSFCIHSFSDGSRRMYAGVVYFRFVLKSGIVKSLLVSSECKISSINGNSTVSRAEFNGLLLMSQIALVVYSGLKGFWFL